MEDKVLTVEEVAELLRVERKTVLKLLQSGKLRGAKVGKAWRVLGSEVTAYLRGEQREG